MLSNRIDQLASPPRPVPLRVAFRAMLGLTGALGAIFLLFGMFFVWIFVGDLQPIAAARLALSTTATGGIITDVDVTNATENGATGDRRRGAGGRRRRAGVPPHPDKAL